MYAVLFLETGQFIKFNGEIEYYDTKAQAQSDIFCILSGLYSLNVYDHNNLGDIKSLSRNMFEIVEIKATYYDY